MYAVNIFMFTICAVDLLFTYKNDIVVLYKVLHGQFDFMKQVILGITSLYLHVMFVHVCTCFNSTDVLFRIYCYVIILLLINLYFYFNIDKCTVITHVHAQRKFFEFKSIMCSFKIN